MSDAANCACPCPTPAVVTVPGTGGDAGDNGTNGVNAFSYLTNDATFTDFVTAVSCLLTESEWLAVGQVIYIENGGYFEVVTVGANGSCTLKYLEYTNQSVPITVPGGDLNKVSPAGLQSELAVSLPNEISPEDSGGVASDTISTLANQRFVTIGFPILLTSSPLTATGDIVTDFVLPFKGAAISWQLVTEVVATSGGAGDVDIELQLSATSITGSKITGLAVTDCNAIGKVKAGGTITALNEFNAGSIFSIVCTESTTDFTAGKVNAYVTFAVREDNLTNAIATLADKVNGLIASLAP